jgi:hypothetical protein
MGSDWEKKVWKERERKEQLWQVVLMAEIWQKQGAMGSPATQIARGRGSLCRRVHGCQEPMS